MSSSRKKLTHINRRGEATMVDVASKSVTVREAVATASVVMAPATLRALVGGHLPKGDALAASRIAGIAGAKRASDLIPLCHPIALTHVAIEFTPRARQGRLEIRATARATDRTGVEMEAMTAAAVAALTIYDMVKGVERGVSIAGIELVEKRGGKSGTWQRLA